MRKLEVDTPSGSIPSSACSTRRTLSKLALIPAPIADTAPTPIDDAAPTAFVNRTVAEVRVLFRKGQMGSSGSVSWDFDHLGMIEAEGSADADAELAAIEAGAQDFEAGEEGVTIFYTEATDLDAVTKALPEFGFTVSSSKLGYKSKNPVSLSGEALDEVIAFLEAMDDHDDVQNVYVGLA